MQYRQSIDIQFLDCCFSVLIISQCCIDLLMQCSEKYQGHQTMETNLFTSDSNNIFVATLSYRVSSVTEQPCSNSTKAGNGICGTCAHLSTVSLKYATVQRRCKESIVMPTDQNVGPEENVTQMMTNKSQPTVKTAKAWRQSLVSHVSTQMMFSQWQTLSTRLYRL